MTRATLRGRLARYYAGVLALVLVVFAGVAWAIIEAEEAAEPPEVAALEPPEHTDRNLAIALCAALLVAVPLAAWGASVVARRGLRALDDVIDTASHVSTEQLGTRVALRDDAPSEVAQLVASLNEMLERLECSVSGIRRFTADASHELRTPLAAVMAELELALRHPRPESELRETMGGALESIQGMARLVESLLALAQADANALPLQPQSIDLAATVRRVVEPYEDVVQGRGATLHVTTDAVLAHSDALWVGRVVANLVDNAAKQVGAGGVVSVRVATEAGRARVEVEDDGPGVPAADAERIFERFYRGEAARASGQGVGLGLALSRQIARALGGELTLIHTGPSPRFVFTLPT